MLGRNRIDFEVAKDVNEIVGNRVKGKEDALRVGVASLCLSIATALHQFTDAELGQEMLAEALVLLSDLYFNGWSSCRYQKNRRLH